MNVLKILKGLPIEKICGVGPRLKVRFNLLGIRTCDQLAEYPEYILVEHFGVMGRWLKAVCRGEEVGTLADKEDDSAPPKSVGHSQTLREVTSDQEFIKDWTYLLSSMVAARLRRGDLQGKTVHFYISDGFASGFSKQKTFADPTYDGQEIYHRCLHIIGLLGIQRLCARVLAVSVTNLSPLDNHFLFERQIKRDRLLKSLDRINDRFGEWTIFPASLKGAQ